MSDKASPSAKYAVEVGERFEIVAFGSVEAESLPVCITNWFCRRLLFLRFSKGFDYIVSRIVPLERCAVDRLTQREY